MPCSATFFWFTRPMLRLSTHVKKPPWGGEILFLDFVLSTWGSFNPWFTGNFSGRLYNPVFMGLTRKTGGFINYDKIQAISLPKNSLSFYNRWSFWLFQDMDFKRFFREIVG